MSADVTRAAFVFRPYPLLAGLALLVLFLVSAARVTDYPVDVFHAPLASSLALQFEDRAGGSIAIIDAVTGREVAQIEGEQGFARGVLRALARERKRQQLGQTIPFLLQSHTDGSLTLSDPATRQTIHLDSFGPAQKAVFAKLQPLNVHFHEGLSQ